MAPDTPTPTEDTNCPDCENDGYVAIVDHETGGVLGPAPCPNPDCPVKDNPDLLRTPFDTPTPDEPTCDKCGSSIDPVSKRSLYHFDVDVPMAELRGQLREAEASAGVRLIQAIKEADASGQWSQALDLIRTQLVEPLEAKLRKAEAELARYRDREDELIHDEAVAIQALREAEAERDSLDAGYDRLLADRDKHFERAEAAEQRVAEYREALNEAMAILRDWMPDVVEPNLGELGAMSDQEADMHALYHQVLVRALPNTDPTASTGEESDG